MCCLDLISMAIESFQHLCLCLVLQSLDLSVKFCCDLVLLKPYTIIWSGIPWPKIQKLMMHKTIINYKKMPPPRYPIYPISDSLPLFSSILLILLAPYISNIEYLSCLSNAINSIVFILLCCYPFTPFNIVFVT